MSDQIPPTRRARETARVWHVRRNALIAVSVVIVLGAGAATAYTLHTNADAKTPATSPSTTPGQTTTIHTKPKQPQSIIDVIKQHNPPRPLSHDTPLRVWVGGDSLSGELGPSLGNALSPSGIVKVTVDFRVGSGLHDHGLRNWPQRAPLQMSQNNPDVAIFMIGANDTGVVTSNADTWTPEYRRRVSEMMDLLGGPQHRTVYWVGPPPMRPNGFERGARALSELMADEATHHQNVVFIDAYTMFADADLHYTNRIDMPALHKTNVWVRIGDGVHFNNDGADWLAFQVAQLLDTQWSITKQSGGKPISVTIEQNGGSIPGYTNHTYPRYSTTTTSYHGTSTSSSTASTSSTTVGSGTTTITNHASTTSAAKATTTVSHVSTTTTQTTGP